MSDPIFSLEDKVIVMTGAAGLVGRTLCKALDERGAKIIGVDIAAANPAKVLGALGLSERAIFLEANVAKAAEVAALYAQVMERHGRCDVLICAHQYKPAGFLEARAEDFPEDLWDAVMETNLKGTFLLNRDFGKSMLAQGSGSIINFGSTYGVVSSNPALYEDNAMGNPLAYSASKGGVLMMSKYLGAYWAGRGVRVNCITPHGVWNNHEPAFEKRFNSMTPMGRMMQPDEVTGAVIFLASGASSYATGSNLLVEGGWSAW